MSIYSVPGLMVGKATFDPRSHPVTEKLLESSFTEEQPEPQGRAVASPGSHP